MQAVISKLQRSENYKEGLRATCRANRINVEVLSGLTLKKMRLFWERTLKHYEGNPTKAQTNWFENELRLYHWILLIESFLQTTPLSQLSQCQWQRIHALFIPKSLQMLQFQARKLINSSPAELHRPWLPDEIELLRSIMADTSLVNKWNDVSRLLYDRSECRHYRSGKQCREQWFNHLDLSKKRGQWTDEQDRLILEFVIEHGHKWAELCRSSLPSRTEHMIKNRFKSLLIRNLSDKNRSNFNERKIIRKILSRNKQQKPQHDPPFKILNLKTYHTQQGELVEADQDSMIERLPPARNSSLINNTIPQRQNQQNQEILHHASIPCQDITSPLPCISSQNNSSIYAYYPLCQITDAQILTQPVSQIVPTVYTLFATPLIFTHIFPQNQP